jgi:hypothetical protein
MREARVALAVGLALTVLAVLAVLAHSPDSVARANGIAAQDPLGQFSGRAKLCQTGESLPRGTSAIVISLSAFHGPRVAAQALSGTRVLTRGEQDSNWTGRTIAIPVKPLARTIAGATICVEFSTAHEPVSPFGQPTPATLAATGNGDTLPGRVSVEYLRPGGRSWWSLASSTAYRLGLGRADGGAWIAFVAIALMLAAAATLSAALLEELR